MIFATVKSLVQRVIDLKKTMRRVVKLTPLPAMVLFLFTEMCRSVLHQPSLSLPQQLTTPHRLKLVNNITIWVIYSSVAYNALLLLIIMRHSPRKHRENNINATSLHHIRKIKLPQITSICACIRLHGAVEFRRLTASNFQSVEVGLENLGC